MLETSQQVDLRICLKGTSVPLGHSFLRVCACLRVLKSNKLLFFLCRKPSVPACKFPLTLVKEIRGAGVQAHLRAGGGAPTRVCEPAP